MTKRFIVIWISMIILFSFSAAATFCADYPYGNNDGMLYCDDFENNSLDHWTTIGIAHINSTAPLEESYSLGWEAIAGTRAQSSSWNSSSNFNVSFNLSAGDSGSSTQTLAFGQGSSQHIFMAWGTASCASDKFCYFSGSYQSSGVDYADVKYINISVWDNGGVANWALWINGNFIATNLITNGNNDPLTAIDSFLLGQDGGNEDSLMDNILIWNGSFLFPSVQFLNISTPLPPNLSSFNQDVVLFNATVNSSSAFDATFYVNGVINQTLTGVGQGTNVPIEFNLSFPIGTSINLTYFISVNSSSLYENSTSQLIFIDRSDPVINIISPSTTTYSGLIPVNITFIDDNAFKYDINITFNNIVKWSLNDSSLTSSTTVVSQNVNLSGNATGSYTLSASFCDGHTNERIADFNVISRERTLTFDQVVISSRSSQTEYVKKDDRYTFSFTFENLTDEEVFNVRSQQPIYIIENSAYKGHLVTGNKWIDFEGEHTIITERIDQYEVEVTAYTDPTNSFSFDSIGELNCVEDSVSFTYDSAFTPSNYTFNRFQCDVSSTPKSILFSVILIVMVAIWMFSFWLAIPFFHVMFGFVMGFFGWLLASCFEFAIILFTVMAVISLFSGIGGAIKNNRLYR